MLRGLSAKRPNETLLLPAPFGVRQAGAVLAHGTRPAALCLMRCSSAQRYADLQGDVGSRGLCAIGVSIFMRFVETSIFTAALRRHLDDEQYRALKAASYLRPEQRP
jgi:hypothetical protein